MKFRKSFLIGVLCVPALAACGGGQSAPKTFTITFHQDEGDQSDPYKVTEGKTKAEDVQKFQDDIKLNPRTGYDVAWDEYDFSQIHSNYTVEALYTLHEYTITYKFNTDTLGTVKYTIESTDEEVKTKEPTLPTKEGYTYQYASYTVVGKHEDFTVNAVEDPIIYYATFVDEDGEQVGEKVPFTVETTSIVEPTVPTKEHYSGTWEKYEFKAKDMTIKPVYTATTYHASFKNSDDDPSPVVLDFSIESSTITCPTIPSDEHYPVQNWVLDGVHYESGAKVNLENSLKDVVFLKYREGAKYQITLDVNGGTMSEETTVEVEYGKEYKLPVPVFKNGLATFMGWFDKESGEQFDTEGTSSLSSNKSLIARYYADFENESELNAVIPGSRSCIASKEIDNSEKTYGLSSIKVVSNSASKTFSCTFDSDFLTSAFADKNVVAVNFDMKATNPSNKLSYQNSISAPYEHDCCTDSQLGFGLQQYFKTFSLTREKYDAATNKGILICTVGDQSPFGTSFWIDNLRPVTKPLTPWGFENSRLVDYDPTPGTWYNKCASFRNFDNKEIFTYNPTVDCDSKFGFSYDIKSEGIRSLKAYKNSNKNVAVSVMNCGDIASITFDVYVTTELNTQVTFLKGNQTAMDSKNLKANTWTTYTVEKEDFNGNTFLWLTGSPEYEIYFDNIVINLA